MEAWVYFALQFWAGTLKILISLAPNSTALLKTHLTLNLQMHLEDCGTLEAAVLGSAVTCTGWCTAPCSIQAFPAAHPWFPASLLLSLVLTPVRLCTHSNTATPQPLGHWCRAREIVPESLNTHLSPYSTDNVVTHRLVKWEETPFLLTGQQGTQAWKIFLFNCRAQPGSLHEEHQPYLVEHQLCPVPLVCLSLVVIPEEPHTLLCARALQVL